MLKQYLVAIRFLDDESAASDEAIAETLKVVLHEDEIKVVSLKNVQLLNDIEARKTMNALKK